MIARHYDIKCIPLQQEMAEMEAAEERDRMQMLTAALLVLYGVVIGAGATFILGALL